MSGSLIQIIILKIIYSLQKDEEEKEEKKPERTNNERTDGKEVEIAQPYAYPKTENFHTKILNVVFHG